MSSINEGLFALTGWLHTTPLVEFSLWLSDTPLSIFVRSHFFIVPILQTLHILSIAVAFGSVQMINAHVLSIASAPCTMNEIMERFIPWIWGGLAGVVFSGVGIVLSDPPREFLNSVFWIKMVLVITVFSLGLWFPATAGRNLRRWDESKMRPGASVAIRTTAIGISLLWCVTMLAGRWIYYAPV